MARPRLREPGGRWSLAQVHAEAGISLAVTRTLLRRGIDLGDPLGESDVVRLRLAAALMNAPRPSKMPTAESTAVTASRDRQAFSITEDLISARTPDPAVSLMVFATEVVLARTLIRVMATMEDHPGQAMLLLPVGAWVADLPSRSPAAST